MALDIFLALLDLQMSYRSNNPARFQAAGKYLYPVSFYALLVL